MRSGFCSIQLLRATLSASLLLLALSPSPAFAAGATGKPQPAPVAAASKPIPSTAFDPLDSMTRDGSAGSGDPAQASNPAAADSIGSGRSMNIGGAVLRTLLSLALVLALVVGAIKYLKRKGYGTGAASENNSPAAKSRFGVSPAAQLLISAAKPAAASQNDAPAPPIADFELLGTQPLPGSSHTLYKVRVGERVLLLGGNASGALNVLTDLDTEEDSIAAGTGFAPLLSSAMSDEDRRGLGAERLQGATERLTAAIRRAGTVESATAMEWKSNA